MNYNVIQLVHVQLWEDYLIHGGPHGLIRIVH